MTRYEELVSEWCKVRDEGRRIPFADFLVEKIDALTADRDNWRKQALEENARADKLEGGAS